MDTVLAARILMGLSLAFHIVYATIGVGLPLLLVLAEGLALTTGEEEWHAMARRWIRPATLLFAIGAVSGTVLSFELGLLWPRFMEMAGPLVGLSFWMEGYAFFTEAIFLAIYTYAEDRLSRRALFLCTIAAALAACCSAVFVISANAWMNTPAGFSLEEGRLGAIRPLAAFANPAWPHEAVHGTAAACVATSFALAGVYAVALLRGKGVEYHRRGMTLALAVATAALPVMLASGDWAATFLADREQPKLAAAEALFRTTRGASLVIGGWPDPAQGKVIGGIEIPRLLSILARRDPDGVVAGLDEFPAGIVPDPRLVHPFFDLMVGSFFLMAAAAVWFWWVRLLRRPESRALLRMIAVASPFGFVALESGWFVTEFGRQPWAARGLMTVAQGATPDRGLAPLLLVFTLVYLFLTAGLLKMLLRPAPRRLSASQEGRRVDG